MNTDSHGVLEESDEATLVPLGHKGSHGIVGATSGKRTSPQHPGTPLTGMMHASTHVPRSPPWTMTCPGALGRVPPAGTWVWHKPVCPLAPHAPGTTRCL
nr:hypothetical protein StreXyl84_11880 [Streptomyces sp. Xyl84]